MSDCMVQSLIVGYSVSVVTVLRRHCAEMTSCMTQLGGLNDAASHCML